MKRKFVNRGAIFFILFLILFFSFITETYAETTTIKKCTYKVSKSITGEEQDVSLSYYVQISGDKNEIIKFSETSYDAFYYKNSNAEYFYPEGTYFEAKDFFNNVNDVANCANSLKTQSNKYIDLSGTEKKAQQNVEYTKVEEEEWSLNPYDCAYGLSDTPSVMTLLPGNGTEQITVSIRNFLEIFQARGHQNLYNSFDQALFSVSPDFPTNSSFKTQITLTSATQMYGAQNLAYPKSSYIDQALSLLESTTCPEAFYVSFTDDEVNAFYLSNDTTGANNGFIKTNDSNYPSALYLASLTNSSCVDASEKAQKYNDDNTDKITKLTNDILNFKSSGALEKETAEEYIEQLNTSLQEVDAILNKFDEKCTTAASYGALKAFRTRLQSAGKNLKEAIKASTKIEEDQKQALLQEIKIFNYGDGEISCDSIFGAIDSNGNYLEGTVGFVIQKLLNIIKIIAPILLIVFGILDFGKAFLSSDADALKHAQGLFVKRVILAVAVFLMPIIVNLLISWLGMATGYDVNGICR